MTDFNINWTQTDATSGEKATIVGTLTTQMPVVVQPPPGDTTAPSAPTGLAATAASATSAKLTWNAATDNVGVTKYNILRNGALAGVSTVPSYTDTGLVNNTAYTYTVAALDAAGNISGLSAALAFTLTWATTQPPPTGTPQFPNMLAGLHRPSWQVVGVDSYVGIPPGTVLKPASAALQPGVVRSGTTIKLSGTGNTLTFDSFDFSGLDFQWTSGTLNAIFRKCKFSGNGSMTLDSHNYGGSGDITCEDCEFDGKQSGSTLAISWGPDPHNLTVRRCWFHDYVNDFIDNGGGNCYVGYCLMNSLGFGPGSAGYHQDFFQSYGGMRSFVWEYNTAYEPTKIPGGGDSYVRIAQQSSGTVTGVNIHHNTIVFVDGAFLWVFDIDGEQGTGKIVSPIITNNYLTPKGGYGGWCIAPGANVTGAQYTNNYDLTTGNLL